MAKFFSQDVLGVDLRRMFPFATFVLVNFGESGCKIKIFAKTKEFNGRNSMEHIFIKINIITFINMRTNPQ